MMRLLLLVAGAGLLMAVEPITPAEIAAIDVASAANDDGWVAPVSANLDHLASDPHRRAVLDALLAKIDAWPQARQAHVPQRVFALLNVVALADMGRSECEGDLAHVILERLRADPEREAVLQAAAAIALDRDGLTAVPSLPELDLTTTHTPDNVHERIELFARKLVGRLLGTLPVVR